MRNEEWFGTARPVGRGMQKEDDRLSPRALIQEQRLFHLRPGRSWGGSVFEEEPLLDFPAEVPFAL